MKEKLKNIVKEIYEGLKIGIIICLVATVIFDALQIREINRSLKYYNQELSILLYSLDTIKRDAVDNFKRDIVTVKALQELVQNQIALAKELDNHTEAINTIADTIIKNNQAAIEVTNQIIKYIKDYPKLQEFQQKIKELKLLQVNVLIINESIGVQGSGATLKYKNKYYVLSVAHLFNKKTDVLELWENGKRICDLKIIKYSKKLDLALLMSVDENIIPKYYSELSDSEPLTTDKIYVVGNPLGIEDLFSDGRIVRYDSLYAWYYDHSYFGSSGGGIYNLDGKLVGITSVLIASNVSGVSITQIPSFTLNGAIRLNQIKSFLEDVE